MPQNKSQRPAARGSLIDTVRLAIADADAAAKTASAAFHKRAARDRDGHIRDMCGGAWVQVRKPSRRLLTALKALDATGSTGTGAWQVANFGHHANSQSYTAHRLACEAACAVLQRHLADEGAFSVHAWAD